MKKLKDFDANLIRGVMKIKNITVKKIAEELGCTTAAVNQTINNKSVIVSERIEKAIMELLKTDIDDYNKIYLRGESNEMIDQLVPPETKLKLASNG